MILPHCIFTNFFITFWNIFRLKVPLFLQVYQEFQIQLTDLSVDNLLEQFTLAKHTGLEKPGKLHETNYSKKVPLIEQLFSAIFPNVALQLETYVSLNECYSACQSVVVVV